MSIIFLCTTTIVVAAGWSITCDTYKDLPSQKLIGGHYVSIDYGFRCRGLQVNERRELVLPNGSEIIAAAVSLLLVGP